MKNQIFYLLGAGASVMQNKLTKKACLPLANDFNEKLDKLRYFVKEGTTSIYPTDTESILDKLPFQNEALNIFIDKFLKDISSADTIDEAMRYYYLNDNKESFEFNKKMISIIFYIFENIEQTRDPRYKQFLMTMIEGKNFRLPNNIKILNWNYDNQFEHACYEIQDDKENIKNILNDNNYFKINGSANFQEIKKKVIERLSQQQNNELIEIRENFSKFENMPNEIDFAWEEEFESKFINKIKKISNIKNNETQSILVVIGYSFPFINHKYDFELIKAINPTKIYIQNPTIYDESFEYDFLTKMGIYSQIDKFSFKIINDCSRFYIPKEMYEGFSDKSFSVLLS